MKFSFICNKIENQNINLDQNTNMLSNSDRLILYIVE